MKLNFQATVKLLPSRFFFFLNMSSLDRVDKKKKSDACYVQSNLNLHCTQKVIMSHLSVQGLIPTLKDVLSNL